MSLHRSGLWRNVDGVRRMRAWAVTTGKQSDGGEMNCSDLERYLEACLDGGLGRGRLALLKRHVAGCRACRGRIERLCRFERDLHRRFRCMEQSASFWTPLEMSLVEPGLVIDEKLVSVGKVLTAEDIAKLL